MRESEIMDFVWSRDGWPSRCMKLLGPTTYFVHEYHVDNHYPLDLLSSSCVFLVDMNINISATAFIRAPLPLRQRHSAHVGVLFQCRLSKWQVSGNTSGMRPIIRGGERKFPWNLQCLAEISKNVDSALEIDSSLKMDGSETIFQVVCYGSSIYELKFRTPGYNFTFATSPDTLTDCRFFPSWGIPACRLRIWSLSGLFTGAWISPSWAPMI